MFATHGIPFAIKTDYGPPFSSDNFLRYCNALDIKHEFSTPYWPQANGEVERFNQPLGKILKTAAIEGKVFRQELQRFLLQYRTTAYYTTKAAPANCYSTEKFAEKYQKLPAEL